MEINNINFKQYQIATFTKLQKRLLICCLVLSLVSLAVEIGMYITLVVIDQPVAYKITYVLFKIITPNILKFSSLIIALCIYKSKKYDINTKSFFVSLSIYIIASVVAIVHNYFCILLVAPAVTFFVVTIFGDGKILKTLGWFTIPVFLLEVTTFMLDPETGPYVYRVLTLTCAFCFTVISFLYSNTLVRTTADQFYYIHKNYETQSLLIEELKIEPLTKLYNRIAFENTVKRIIDDVKQSHIHPFMVIMDIDFFKKVNDKYGHKAGDQVLIRLSDIIKMNMGGIRKAYRYGGEEFVLLFDNSTESYVKEKVDQIRKDFQSASFLFAPELQVTLSAGISEYKEIYTANDWFEKADKSLYQAKYNGRNQLVIADYI